MPRLAVIGGTGLNQWPGLRVTETRSVSTPYGEASAPVVRGEIDGCDAWFLARHGQGHKIPPHRINYRANLWALRELGVEEIIAVAAVGSIARWFEPASIAVPGDLIDYTWGREHSYADGTEGADLLHVEFSDPYSERVRQRLIDAASASGTAIAGEGVMAVTQGPRLETPAEIRRYAQDGCDMVGMTGMPEAALARELSLHYACLAVSVNWAAGLATGGIHDEIERTVQQGMNRVVAVLRQALVTA